MLLYKLLNENIFYTYILRETSYKLESNYFFAYIGCFFTSYCYA